MIRIMQRVLTAISILIMLFGMSACREERVDRLTYAVFPYLPDAEYYQELIEKRWAEIEPDIRLIRADWDCYYDGRPEGIDVIMYDAITRDSLISAGWIRPIDPDRVADQNDIFPYAMEGLRTDGNLYGIPVFLCGNFLIYDTGFEKPAAAEHITDLAGDSEILVMNSHNPVNRHQYMIEVIADELGEADPSAEINEDDCLRLIDRLAIDAYEYAEDERVALAYDSGAGQGYVGFSESMRLLEKRGAQTQIRAVSFSDKENVPRVYTDAAGVTFGTDGKRYEKCVELMNVMAEADVLAALSVKDGIPQYLMPARKSVYQQLADEFPVYASLAEIAGNERNQVILTP